MKIVFGRKIFVLLLNFFTIISLFYLFKSNRKLFYLSILFFINFTLPYSVGHAANTRFKLDFEWSDIDCVIVPEDAYEVVKSLNLNGSVEIKTYALNTF